MEINTEIINLAKEILDDAELSRTSAESLVFKATRLARLVKNKSMLEWLDLERFGYADKEPDVNYMDTTGRPYDKTTRIGYWGSISTQEAAIEATLAEMEVVKSFRPSGEYSALQFYNQQQQIQTLANKLSLYRKIRSRVIAIIQVSATNVYYEKLFSQKAGDIFTLFSEKINNLLATSTGEVLAMLPSVFERLNSENPEAINQALLSCRRILDAFIDKLYPPHTTPVTVDGEELIIDKEKTKNRYKAYIAERTKSRSLKEKLNKIISILYERTSTGVHSDVTRNETQSLVLQLYVTLGEILTLGPLPQTTSPKDNPQKSEEKISEKISQEATKKEA